LHCTGEQALQCIHHGGELMPILQNQLCQVGQLCPWRKAVSVQLAVPVVCATGSAG
jgi:hypothetical protein